MRGPAGRHNAIFGQRPVTALEIFLQPGLRVLPGLSGIEPFQRVAVDREHRGARRVVSAVEQNGPENRFHRIGEDRWPSPAGVCELAFAQPQLATELQLPRQIA